MIDRRALLSIAATAPFLRKLDLSDIRVDNLDLEQGERILSISPNGKTLVRTRNSERICFFDAATLEEIAASDASDAVKLMFPNSLRWSPDGSKIAFNTLSVGLDDQPNIIVVDANTGDISGLYSQAATPVATPTAGDDIVIQDLFPTWLDDDTLVFVRVEWARVDEGAVLMSAVPGTSDPTVWNELRDLDIKQVYSLTHMREDGRLIFLANPSNTSYLASPDDQSVRLFIAGPDDDIEQIIVEGLAVADLADADDTHALIFDPAGFQTFRIPLDDPSTREDPAELFDLEEGEHTTSIPTIGPTPGSLVVTLSNENRSVLVYLDGRVRELAYLRGPETTGLECMWVDGKVLVTSAEASWLIEVNEL